MAPAHPARLGIKHSPQNTTLDDLRAVWRVADEAGFDHLWGFDHFNPIFSDVSGPILEGWTLLAAMAEATERARIGLMVTGNTYRHPGVLAKMAVTVDHLSGGRLEFGLGAAWAEIEHTMLGLPFYTVGQRIRRLGEACAVIRALWTSDEPVDFDGRYYKLTGAIANPKPVQRPYPPIWIGGSGEKLTLRVVAEHADVWNVAGHLEDVVRKSRILDEHCAAVGRDPGEIRRSIQVFFNRDDPAVTREALEEYMAAGFTENVVVVSAPDPAGAAELVASELLPAVQGRV
jgi:F420-dependent oxidoreductase-like protein